MFEKLFWRLFHSHKQRLCALWYRQGLIDGEIKTLKNRSSLPGLSDVPSLPVIPAIDLALEPVNSAVSLPYVPGERLAEERAKHGLRTIRLEPLQNTDSFPWLPDNHHLNSRLSALHELLGCYAETEKLKAVPKRDERNS